MQSLIKFLYCNPALCAKNCRTNLLYPVASQASMYIYLYFIPVNNLSSFHIEDMELQVDSEKHVTNINKGFNLACDTP